LRPPDLSAVPAPALLEASSNDIGAEGGEAEVTAWRGEGVEMLGSGENPRGLRDLKAGKA
jgi:hypothetical protein